MTNIVCSSKLVTQLMSMALKKEKLGCIYLVVRAPGIGFCSIPSLQVIKVSTQTERTLPLDDEKSVVESTCEHKDMK